LLLMCVGPPGQTGYTGARGIPGGDDDASGTHATVHLILLTLTLHYNVLLGLLSSDVKRGQNAEAKAEAKVEAGHM